MELMPWVGGGGGRGQSRLNTGSINKKTVRTRSPFPKVLALFGPFWKGTLLSPFIAIFSEYRPFELFLAEKVLKIYLLMHAITVSECSRGLGTPLFWGQQVVEACTQRPHCCKKWGF